MGLDLEANRLSGSLPTSFPEALPHLRVLQLAGNALEGGLPMPDTLEQRQQMLSYSVEGNSFEYDEDGEAYERATLEHRSHQRVASDGF